MVYEIVIHTCVCNPAVNDKETWDYDATSGKWISRTTTAFKAPAQDLYWDSIHLSQAVLDAVNILRTKSKDRMDIEEVKLSPCDSILSYFPYAVSDISFKVNGIESIKAPANDSDDYSYYDLL